MEDGVRRAIMRINEVILETVFPPISKLSKEQVLNLLRTRCRKFFKLFNYKMGYNLLRTSSPVNPLTFISESPENREPRDTYYKFHNAINKKLEDAGFVARRNNSVFCRGSSLTLVGTAGTRRIFPMDNFDYTWCHSGDLMLDRNLGSSPWRRGEEIEMGLRKFVPPDSGAQMFLDLKNLTPDDFVEKYGFHNDRLQSAIMQKNEIYIHGSYVAVGDLDIADEIDRVYGG